MGKNAVKVGTVVDNITDHIGRYSNKFISIPFGEPGVHKYGLFIRENKYPMMLLISKRDQLVRTPDGDSYNIMITVMGKDKKRANEILEEFEKKMPFELREAPEFIKKSSQFFFKLVEDMLEKD